MKKGVSTSSISRRKFIESSAVIGGAAVLAQPVFATSKPSSQGKREPTNVIEQIVEEFGGFDFDQDAVEKARREGTTDPRLLWQIRAASSRSHAIQCAMQAEKAGADEAFIVAGLVHDIGHKFAAPAPAGMEEEYDDLHGWVGAHWLRNAFVPEVSEPVLLHVPGKRYLVTTRPEYFDHLSGGSKDSLRRQGGPMTDAEIQEFETGPHWKWGVEVRIWDDNAKVKNFRLPGIERFVPFLEASLKG
jgi:predicted HD phosphohydrolase